MDWEQANVSLDQDAFRDAQSQGSSFHIPVFWIVVAVLVLAVAAYSITKKSKSGDKSGTGAKTGK